MRCDVLTIGTELLLGQIVDTNSTWIGEAFAASGIDTYDQRKVGDNVDRMVAAIRDQLRDADAVLCCGGLGPTQDDVTREAFAEVLGVPLERHDDLVAYIQSVFTAQGRVMTDSNLRQADIPAGAAPIPNPVGTAPGIRAELVGPGGRPRVIYAVPGVPSEMRKMVTEHVLPDLVARSGTSATIMSRSLKCWGIAESTLSELIAERVDVQGNPTIAFLARGIEGLYVRLTAKAATPQDAQRLLDDEEAMLRPILGERLFGADDDTMESVVLAACAERGWTLAVAESLTGGFVGGRLADVPGASSVFRGSIAAYATEVKRSVLGVTAEHVVSEECVIQMAEAAQRVLGSDVGLAVTGVAGPDPQDDQPVGTVWLGVALPGRATEALKVSLPGDRTRIRQFATISLLDLARRRLGSAPSS